MSNVVPAPSVTVTYGTTGASKTSNELGMRADAGARLHETRRAIPADQVAAGLAAKSRALMFIALDKLENQGLQPGDHRRARARDRRIVQG